MHPMKAMSLPLALLGLVCIASADSLKSEIQSFDVKIDSAMRKNDMASFTKLMKSGATSDFKYSEAGQTMGFEQMLAMMKQGMAMMKKITQVKSELLSLRTAKGRAEGTTSHLMAGTIIGPDKHVHTMKFVGESLDVYRKEGGTWKMASMTWKHNQSYMDGKPMDMSKMGK